MGAGEPAQAAALRSQDQGHGAVEDEQRLGAVVWIEHLLVLYPLRRD